MGGLRRVKERCRSSGVSRVSQKCESKAASSDEAPFWASGHAVIGPPHSGSCRAQTRLRPTRARRGQAERANICRLKLVTARCFLPLHGPDSLGPGTVLQPFSPYHMKEKSSTMPRLSQAGDPPASSKRSPCTALGSHATRSLCMLAGASRSHDRHRPHLSYASSWLCLQSIIYLSKLPPFAPAIGRPTAA
jgi:hypothetical protein